MSNSVGLLVIGFSIALIVAFVVFVHWMARRRSDTLLGRICKAIDSFIERLPED